MATGLFGARARAWNVDTARGSHTLPGMMNPTPGRPLYFVEEVVAVEDFPVEPLEAALRRSRLRSGRAVFVAWEVGVPHRHIATWTAGAFQVGDGATPAEREVIAAVGAEPRPASLDRGVRLITVGGSPRGMAAELRGGVPQ